MKKVFSNSFNVMHLFNEQTQSEARCTNVFFYDNKIYSYGYHYLLGEFINYDTIIINNKGYSSTTNKHISQLTSATSDKRQFFTKNIDPKLVLQELKFLSNKLQKAKKPDLYKLPALELLKNYFEFIQFQIDNNINRFLYEIDLDNEIKEYAKIFVENLSIETAIENISKLQSEALKKENEIKAKKHKKDLDKFYNYETNYINNKINYDYLRLSICGLFIETSQGIKIPIIEAKKLYELILSKIDIKGYNLSGYIVASINGSLKIGCHNINTKDVHKIGKLILNN